MAHYPKELAATAEELLQLPSGRKVSVPKTSVVLQGWKGNESIDSYGGKALVDLDGEALFAELAILRLFERSGWTGVWVDTYRRKYRTQFSDSVPLPEKMNEQLTTIYEKAGSKNGCWDVLCWQGDDIIFAESKRFSRDRIRNSQLAWMESALAIGISLNSFLIVEWTLR